MMIGLLFAAAVYTAAPGSVVQLEIPNEPRLKSVHVIWQEKKVPAFQVNDLWTTILGIDLDTKAGAHRAEALLTMDDGSIDGREITINVPSKKFPTRRLKVDQRFVQLGKADVNRADREAKEAESIYGRMTTDLVPDEAFTVPIPGGTGTNFGERRFFNGEPRAPHSGADLRATTGTPVHATNRGRVVLAKALFFTGETVILDHGLGIYSLYAHLSRVDVKRGDIVTNGQIVGLVGATGRVTAPHLHWGMRVQGARVDPFSLVGLGSVQR
jgi:murein DD-endopeptidase MepM/ murein hydrolase activator NlpD